MDNQSPYMKYGPQPASTYAAPYAGYPTNYQPYYNSYPNYNQNMQPTQQATPTLQSMTQNVAPVVGRWVDSPSEIAPRDIPMDGTIAIFPSRREDKIYAKAWGADGSITTMTFEPVKEDRQPEKSIGEFDQIMEKLSKIEESLKSNTSTAKRMSKETN